MKTETSITQPSLNEGEVYLGIFTDPETRAFEHVTLLPVKPEDANWNDGMAVAAKLGGDLPNRSEWAFLHMTMPELFKRDWYWSSTQHAADSTCAWCQDFDYGCQLGYDKSVELCVRVVRRLPI